MSKLQSTRSRRRRLPSRKPILCGLCALRELAVAKEVIADLKQRLTVATEEAKADIRGRLTDAIDRVLH